MGGTLRLIGSQMSPYSVKLRSYLLYKEIPFEWIERGRRNEQLFQRHAKVQLIPLVIFPDDTAMQDSTLIIEKLEAEWPEPSIHPPGGSARFLSELLEEFGDEWCNKLMFQYRWGARVDQKSTGTRLANLMTQGHPLRFVRPVVARFIVRRMVPRLAFAGANATNRPHLETSWGRCVEILEAHLSGRAYLFGGRPSFGDFGVWAQFAQAYSDVTAGGQLRASAPALVAWVERMRTPTAEGDFEPIDDLLPTLHPLLEEQVAGRFLAWTAANHRALDAGEEKTRLLFDGALYEQKTFKYHAWSLAELQSKLESRRSDALLGPLLEATGCAPHLGLEGSVPGVSAPL